MCKAPKPPKPKEPKKPEFLRNRYLDEFVGQRGAVQSIKSGRGSLRIPLGSPGGIGGRNPGESLVKAPNTGQPSPSFNPNARPSPRIGPRILPR